MSIFSLSFGHSKLIDQNQSLNGNVSEEVPKNEQLNSFMTQQPQKTNFILNENNLSVENFQNFENKSFSMIENIQNICDVQEISLQEDLIYEKLIEIYNQNEAAFDQLLNEIDHEKKQAIQIFEAQFQDCIVQIPERILEMPVDQFQRAVENTQIIPKYLKDQIFKFQFVENFDFQNEANKISQKEMQHQEELQEIQTKLEQKQKLFEQTESLLLNEITKSQNLQNDILSLRECNLTQSSLLLNQQKLNQDLQVREQQQREQMNIQMQEQIQSKERAKALNVQQNMTITQMKQNEILSKIQNDSQIQQLILSKQKALSSFEAEKLKHSESVQRQQDVEEKLNKEIEDCQKSKQKAKDLLHSQNLKVIELQNNQQTLQEQYKNDIEAQITSKEKAKTQIDREKSEKEQLRLDLQKKEKEMIEAQSDYLMMCKKLEEKDQLLMQKEEQISFMQKNEKEAQVNNNLIEPLIKKDQKSARNRKTKKSLAMEDALKPINDENFVKKNDIFQRKDKNNDEEIKSEEIHSPEKEIQEVLKKSKRGKSVKFQTQQSEKNSARTAKNLEEKSLSASSHEETKKKSPQKKKGAQKKQDDSNFKMVSIKQSHKIMNEDELNLEDALKNQNKKNGKMNFLEASQPMNQNKKEAQSLAQKQNQSRTKSRRKNKAIMEAINAQNQN